MARFSQDTFGFGKKKIAGNKAKTKRKAANNKGGRVKSVSFITTKLLPQTATTAKANKK